MSRKKRGVNSRTIPLGSGGSITMSHDFDLFELSADDRAFVNGIIDSLRAYEDAQARSTGKGSGGRRAPASSSSSKTSGSSKSSSEPAPKGSRRTSSGHPKREEQRVGADDG